MSSSSDIQRAISDLAVIRRAIERVGGPEVRRPAVATILVQGGAFCLAILFAGFELRSDHAQTALLVLSRDHEWVRVSGIADVAILLLLITVSVYLIVSSAARKQEESLDSYLAKHFHYLKNFSFLADLFVKFVIFSLIVLARKPEWIAPLLSLFTADYLFQGRLFTLPVRLALGVGALCVVAAVYQFRASDPTLLYPLLTFSLVSGLSLLLSLRSYRTAGAAE